MLVVQPSVKAKIDICGDCVSVNNPNYLNMICVESAVRNFAGLRAANKQQKKADDKASPFSASNAELAQVLKLANETQGKAKQKVP
jgi:hypothetical protein